MPVTHQWSVEDMHRKTSDGGVYDVVATVSSTDGTNTVQRTIKVGFAPDPSNTNYTPYNDLTEAQVLSWVFAEVDQAAIEEGQEINLSAEAEDASGTPW